MDASNFYLLHQHQILVIESASNPYNQIVLHLLPNNKKREKKQVFSYNIILSMSFPKNKSVNVACFLQVTESWTYKHFPLSF